MRFTPGEACQYVYEENSWIALIQASYIAMKIITTIAELRTHLAPYQRAAFVPTMGNLHAGHLALVHQAKPLGDVLVVSIFINRLQFLPHEDFDSYPRTWEADCKALQDAGCDVLFAPSEQALYPEPQAYKVQPPPELADILEGHFRPGFFVGVCTVVLKLFNCVRPAVAVFGQKDYQQLMVIRRMVAQLALPIEVLGGPTLRSADGLALSSRNTYLSATERAEAVHLSQTLQQVAQALRTGESDINKLEQQAVAALTASAWQADYIAVRRRADLKSPPKEDVAALTESHGLVILGAARIGKTRLIDNLEV
jgi:pantoate--beta-alanine ligase